MEKRKNPSPANPELSRRIHELIQTRGGGHNPDLVADIIENALKLLSDVEHRGDVRVIQTAVRELRYAFRLFAPYDHRRKVTIFGSARTQPDKPEYHQAQEFGRLAADAGFSDIIPGSPMQSIEPTPEEVEDNDELDKPRVAFGFNRHDYGRLRQLLDALNAF